MVNSAVRLCGALTHLQHQTTVNVKRKSLQIIRNDNVDIKCPNDGLFNENVLFHKNLRYKCS